MSNDQLRKEEKQAGKLGTTPGGNPSGSNPGEGDLKFTFGKEKPDNHVHVAVITTSGSFPSEGFEQVPVHQKISVFVKKAVEKLKIVSVDGWVAKVGNKEINLEKTYLESQLTGEMSIDYGPREGGGGADE